MAEKHDELCEKAAVGSVCDCSCAGAKHAVRNTRGGVPGAAAVSRKAQKAASAAGKAAVVNSRAKPKQGARVSPAAPKASTAAGEPVPASAPKRGAPILNDKGEPAKTYDRLPSGLLMNRNPWHPPDIDESKVSTSRDTSGGGEKINVTYDGRPLGSYKRVMSGNYVVEIDGKPLKSGPMPTQFASTSRAYEALMRATAQYEPGTVVAFNQSFGPNAYATFVAHNRDDHTVTLRGADGATFKIAANDVIGQDNRKRADALSTGGKTAAANRADLARRDDDGVKVTSRRRNGAATSETVKPARRGRKTS